MGVPSRQRAIRRIAGNWSSAASWPATTLRRRSDLPSRRGSGRFGPVASDRPGRGYSRMRKRERMREHELTHLRAHRTSDGSLVVEFWANELPYQIRIRDKGVLQEIPRSLGTCGGGGWTSSGSDCRSRMRGLQRANAPRKPPPANLPRVLAPALIAHPARTHLRRIPLCPAGAPGRAPRLHRGRRADRCIPAAWRPPGLGRAVGDLLYRPPGSMAN